jgi:hypothetical protein
MKNGQYTAHGPAWGAPITRVQVPFDQGPWTAASMDEGQPYEFAWKFWHLDWKNPSPDVYCITSRATDRDGNVQPAMNNSQIAKKHSYWESNGQSSRSVRI